LDEDDGVKLYFNLLISCPKMEAIVVNISAKFITSYFAQINFF
jgi:hypothetical protein